MVDVDRGDCFSQIVNENWPADAIDCEDVETVEVQPTVDWRLHPAWNDIVTMERAPELLCSEECFDPTQPVSSLIPRDILARPIFGDEWLEPPFPAVAIPFKRIRLGDNVLISLSFEGDISVQGTIKSGPGSIFGAGPNAMRILS